MFEGLGWWAWWLLMMVCDIVWWYYMIVSSSMFIVAHEHLAWRHAVPKGIWEDRGSASREKGLELLTALPVCVFFTLVGWENHFRPTMIWQKHVLKLPPIRCGHWYCLMSSFSCSDLTTSYNQELCSRTGSIFLSNLCSLHRGFLTQLH